MNSITFDTLKFAPKLKAAGVPEGQAEAFAEALESQLAIEGDLAKIEKELLLIKWMVGLVIAAKGF